jgi:two-component system, NtrC family, response regulator AtoC
MPLPSFALAGTQRRVQLCKIFYNFDEPQIELRISISKKYHTRMGFKALIVDDEVELCRTLSKILINEGYACCYTPDPLEFEDLLDRERPDLVIMDVRMPRLGGLHLLRKFRLIDSDLPVLMMSGYASAESIVQAMKIGATNFYAKPLKIPSLLAEIATLAERAMQRALRREDDGGRSIVTRDAEMIKVLGLIEKVAKTDVSVVVVGESGTGKELVATAIHRQSRRSAAPMIKLNCAAIPETLLESELFGHEKGAFTDACAARVGKFEEAEGGTLFLDEIGDMSPRTQAKLLRVLQEKRFERVGSNQVRKADVRFVAATNRRFEDMIREGSFRGDLYYRLSVVKLEVPPLRRRRADIPLLADHFLREFSEFYGKPVKAFEPDVERVFLAHDWPGNVRELRNCVERAVIFAEGDTITADSLPLQYDEVRREVAEDYRGLLASVNREMILDAIDKAGGNKTEAASLLSMTRRTLYNKMKTLGIPL